MELLPQAKLSYAGSQSRPFRVNRGTRQGCPLSRLLFALYLEPFIRVLLVNQNILPLSTGPNELKVNAYADDIAIFTSDPGQSLELIIQEAGKFWSFSGYKLNTNKTQVLLNFIPDSPIMGTCPEATYLGVYITPQIETIIKQNYDVLLGYVIKKFRNWHKLPISRIGRCNTVKMTILPKCLYLFRSIPLKVSNLFFKKLDGAVSSFIWGYKHARHAINL